MINKTYKRIHNKYSTLFKFIFFLRYLFGIFFIAAVLFLTIPHLFDFKKKEEVIKRYLLEDYGLKLTNYESIKYNSLPTPSLEILNATIFLITDSVKLESKNLKIYPKLINIYSFKNLKAKKIILNKSKTSLKITELQTLRKYILEIKNRIKFNDLELKTFREDELLINIKDINFSNYGYNKNLINGQIFNKKFKIIINDSFNKINFKLLNTGISIDLNFSEIKKDNTSSGVLKVKVLNSNLKFSFEYDDKKFKIYNSYFRNKDLSFKNKSVITYHPFFSINSNYNIEDINIKVLKDLDLNKILESKKIIKKINSKNIISYKPKIFSKNFVDNLNLKINLAYGRLFYSTTLLISDNSFNCEGESNLLEEFPVLYFNCYIVSKDKKKLLKEFSINYKNKNEPLNLNVKGNLNPLSKKINFNNIRMNKNYNASKEDLNYFKGLFERIFLNENLLNIFKLNKIKEFILELS